MCKFKSHFSSSWKQLSQYFQFLVSLKYLHFCPIARLSEDIKYVRFQFQSYQRVSLLICLTICLHNSLCLLSIGLQLALLPVLHRIWLLHKLLTIRLQRPRYAIIHSCLLAWWVKTLFHPRLHASSCTQTWHCSILVAPVSCITSLFYVCICFIIVSCWLVYVSSSVTIIYRLSWIDLIIFVLFRCSFLFTSLILLTASYQPCFRVHTFRSPSSASKTRYLFFSART